MAYVNLFMKPSRRSDAIKKKIEPAFEEHGYHFSRIYREDAVFNIVIGGDGSFLRAVNQSHFSPLPFLGINTGHLGFYQELDGESLDHYLQLLFKREYSIDSLHLLEAKIYTNSWDFTVDAVNEFLVTTNDQKMLRLALSIDGVKLIHQAGDGLIFSTPSGSTAYNLSSGGSILYQTLDGYQISALAPIRSESYTSLPASLVVPSDSISRVEFDTADRQRILLVADGKTKNYLGVQRIDFYVPDRTIQRMVFNKNWYWQNIREKLIGEK